MPRDSLSYPALTLSMFTEGQARHRFQKWLIISTDYKGHVSSDKSPRDWSNSSEMMGDKCPVLARGHFPLPCLSTCAVRASGPAHVALRRVGWNGVACAMCYRSHRSHTFDFCPDKTLWKPVRGDCCRGPDRHSLPASLPNSLNQAPVALELCLGWLSHIWHTAPGTGETLPLSDFSRDRVQPCDRV